MKNKNLFAFLGLFSASLLLAGCESTSDECSEAKETVNVAQGPTPGSAEDFRATGKDRVFFHFDRSHITEDASKILGQQAAWLSKYNNTKVVVEGHCDERGTREYNQALGAARAAAAQAVLASHGVDANRMTTISYGKDKPQVANAATEEDHARNRVAITVVQ